MIQDIDPGELVDEYGGLLSTLLLRYAQQLQEEWCLNHAEGRCYACMQLTY